MSVSEIFLDFMMFNAWAEFEADERLLVLKKCLIVWIFFQVVKSQILLISTS